MHKIKTILTAISVIVLTFISVGSLGSVAYAAQNTISDVTALECGTLGGTFTAGTGTTGKGTCTGENLSKVDADKSVQDKIAKIINILSWVVGVISVIMIIVAGFKYVTSGGNEKGVSGAKSTILYAIVGLVIVALAQVIVRFVLTNVS